MNVVNILPVSKSFSLQQPQLLENDAMLKNQKLQYPERAPVTRSKSQRIPI